MVFLSLIASVSDTRSLYVLLKFLDNIRTMLQPWSITFYGLTLWLHLTSAGVVKPQPRDATSNFRDILDSNGGNSFTWDAGSFSYNITMEVDSNCPSALSESMIVGPYRTTRGTLLPNATIGDIASDVSNPLNSGLLYRSIRRNIADAKRELQDLLSQTILCDDKDYQFDVEVHDEFRRKLLDINRFTYVLLGSTAGFVVGVGWLGAIKGIFDDEPASTPELVAAGLTGFSLVSISAATTNLIHNDQLGQRPAVFFAALAAYCRRLVLAAASLFMRRVNPVGAGAGVGEVQDIEMGNAGAVNGGANVNVNGAAAGGKVKRDAGNCVNKADAIKALEAIGFLQSDALGFSSWDGLSKKSPQCGLSE